MRRFLRVGSAIALSACFVGTSAQARWFMGGYGDGDEGWFPPGLVSVPPGQEKEKNKDKDKGPDDERVPPGLCKTDDVGPDGRAGKSHVAHVNFAPVDEQGAFIDEEMAPWGRMTYFWQGPTFDFVFNGHNFPPVLEPDGLPDYVLTYQPELETLPILCLGEGEVNDEGDIHIANSVELDTDLPVPEDTEAEGASLALMPADEINCETGMMTPTVEGIYLYSISGVIYEDTNLED